PLLWKKLCRFGTRVIAPEKAPAAALSLKVGTRKTRLGLSLGRSSVSAWKKDASMGATKCAGIPACSSTPTKSIALRPPEDVPRMKILLDRSSLPLDGSFPESMVFREATILDKRGLPFGPISFVVCASRNRSLLFDL